MRLPNPKNLSKNFFRIAFLSLLLLVIVSGLWGYLAANTYVAGQTNLKQQLISVNDEFTRFKNIDQVKKNQELEQEIRNINLGFLKAANLYQGLQDLKVNKVDTNKLDVLYASAIKLLADKNYASASASLIDLEKQIKTESDKQAAANIPKTTSSAPTSTTSTAPNSGYSVVGVDTDAGKFSIALVAADLNSTRVIVDTASPSDCANDCPVLSLGEYVSRNGAFAGINGSFFCPATYPNCAGKTNSFDTLLMNKNKTYFNSDNNVYSTVPAVIFSNGGIRFVSRSLEWGRDTSIDGMIANYPLYVHGGNRVDFSTSDAKLTSKGSRGFVANKGSTVYIGFVYNATTDEASKALKAMGVENALGLDQGGSSALWSGGYKIGPGRNIPNAILFVRK